MSQIYLISKPQPHFAYLGSDIQNTKKILYLALNRMFLDFYLLKWFSVFPEVFIAPYNGGCRGRSPLTCFNKKECPRFLFIHCDPCVNTSGPSYNLVKT